VIKKEEPYLTFLQLLFDSLSFIISIGHRFSTGELEEVIQTHSSVAECAVIGKTDSIKGQIPVAFIVLKVVCVIFVFLLNDNCRMEFQLLLKI
jgi:acyl-CoA synthetase (AMP-forming)/AMP-acid ligase II